MRLVLFIVFLIPVAVQAQEQNWETLIKSTPLVSVYRRPGPRGNEIVLVAKGSSVGARCIYSDEAEPGKLQSASGVVTSCKAGCLPIEGGAVCQNKLCDYVFCVDGFPWNSCERNEHGKTGRLSIMALVGACYEDGFFAGDRPGECHYPETVVDCGGGPDSCNDVGNGEDFCLNLPKGV